MVRVVCGTTLVVATLFVLHECVAGLLPGNISVVERFDVGREDIHDIYYPHSNSKNPYRIRVWSPYAKMSFPVLVVVRQQRRVVSWQVPLLVDTPTGTIEHQNTARTLCYDSDETIDNISKGMAKVARVYPPNKTHTCLATLPWEPRECEREVRGFNFFKKDIRRNFTLSLSTSSVIPVVVYVQVEEVRDFFIQGDVQYDTTFSPSEPVYYSYDFPVALMSGRDIKTVLIHVTSEDSTCFVVSVQPKLCPVRDLNDDISFEGKYQTVNTKGGLTISRLSFRNGFYLVFVAMGNNFACSEQNNLLPQPLERQSTKSSNQSSRITFEVRTGRTGKEYTTAIMAVFGIMVGLCLLFVLITYLYYRFGNYRKMSLKEIETAEPPQARIAYFEDDEPDNIILKTDLKVADFVKKGNRNHRKAFNYFYHIANIAIFYGIPVIQLMVAYQRAVDASGDLDICYHNFHCSHPLYFTDFNHIYSNIGYILFGILFICITLFRSMKMRNLLSCGIPKYHGLYYAMGMALIFEGVFSGCYHICPTQSNFQFDTSFMYMMAVLIIVKLYQNRHPDINASAYTTFTVLGIAVIIVMCGILYNNLAIMIVFIFSYISLCIYMAFKIYFFGHVLVGWKRMYKAYKNNESKLEAIKPIRLGQFIMLTIANICNISIAITGIALYPSQVDFGTFLLGILMLNAIMYAMFYMIMKLICNERICIEAIMYGVLSLIFWAFGAYFFMNVATLSSVTPAESRKLNQECILFGFYDTHDVWHLLSAPALFMSFMFLQTLDDDLFDKSQKEIHAF